MKSLLLVRNNQRSLIQEVNALVILKVHWIIFFQLLYEKLFKSILVTKLGYKTRPLIKTYNSFSEIPRTQVFQKFSVFII